MTNAEKEFDNNCVIDPNDVSPVLEQRARHPAIEGSFQGVVNEIIHGSLLAPAGQSFSLTIEVLVDTLLCASTSIGTEEIVSDQNHHAINKIEFSIPLPAEALDGNQHVLDLRIKELDYILPGSSYAYIYREFADIGESAYEDRQSLSLIGNFDEIYNGRARGWAYNHNEPSQQLVLELYVDANLSRVIVADDFRPDLLQAGFGNGKHGFDIQLPKTIYDGKLHEVNVVVSGAKIPLPNSPKSVEFPAPTGVFYFERAAGIFSGWITEGFKPSIEFNGHRLDDILTLPADIQKLPHEVSDNIAGAVRFIASIPTYLRDGSWHEVAVKFEHNGQHLCGSPLAFRSLLAEVDLQITNFTGDLIRGWARYNTNPTDAVKLHVYIDGDYFGEVLADSSRVRTNSVDPNRPNNYFSMPIPNRAKVLEFSLSATRGKNVIAKYNLCAAAETSSPKTLLATTISNDLLAKHEVNCYIANSANAFFSEPGNRFDHVWYTLNYPDVAKQIQQGVYLSAWEHYKNIGHRTGYSPSPNFDEMWYLSKWSAVAEHVAAGDIPCGYAHYLSAGVDAMLDPIPGFSSQEYAASCPDAILDVQGGEYTDLLEHWLAHVDVTSYRPSEFELTETLVLPRRVEYDADNTALPSTSSFRASSEVYKLWLRRITGRAEDYSVAREIDLNDEKAIEYCRDNKLYRAPLVSIIMPTYNRAYTIAEAIQSVIDQSYQNWELLVCDDGSTDKTSLVVDQFADDRIRYMNFEKSNGAITRNKGLSLARGEYIAYLDSDNMWHPLYLEIMMRHLTRSCARPLAYCGYVDTEIVRAEVKVQSLSNKQFDVIQLTNRNFIDLNTICHHSNLIAWLGDFDEGLVRLQDWDLTLRFLSIFNPINVPLYLAYYRRNVAWGQVTHAFANSDTRSIVMNKTSSRTDLEHLSLKLPWKNKAHMILIHSPDPGFRFLAESFASCIEGLADLTICSATKKPYSADERHESLQNINRLSIGRESFLNPSKLADSLLPFVSPDTIVLCIGVSTDFARQFAGEMPVPVDSVEISAEGMVISSKISDLPFYIGAVPPVMFSDGDDAGGKFQDLLREEGRILLFIEGDSTYKIDVLETQKNLVFREKTYVLILPYDPFDGQWKLVSHEDITVFDPREYGGVKSVLSRVDTFAVAFELEKAHPAAIMMIIEGLREGKVVMLPTSPLTRSFIDAKAVYNVQTPRLDWIIDKAVRLSPEHKDAKIFSKNACKAHKIALHGELARERISFYLHQRSQA